MKRTPWLFLVLKLLALALIALGTYVAKDGPAGLPEPFRSLGNLIAGRADLWIFSAAIGAALLDFAERAVRTLQFRKRKVQSILDHIVWRLFHNKPKDNRCTLFRAAKGYKVIPILFWRALLWQEDKVRHLRCAFINPLGTYLYVWARAKGSRNHHSCVAFRVHNTTSRHSQGMAGRVWERDVFEAHDLPALSSTDFDGVTGLGGLPADHAVARYAKASNIEIFHQLRARERFARHFYGSVIESTTGAPKWGIILVDSVEGTCPWPVNKKGGGAVKLKDFGKDFEVLTLVLCTILT